MVNIDKSKFEYVEKTFLKDKSPLWFLDKQDEIVKIPKKLSLKDTLFRLLEFGNEDNREYYSYGDEEDDFYKTTDGLNIDEYYGSRTIKDIYRLCKHYHPCSLEKIYLALFKLMAEYKLCSFICQEINCRVWFTSDPNGAYGSMAYGIYGEAKDEYQTDLVPLIEKFQIPNDKWGEEELNAMFGKNTFPYFYGYRKTFSDDDTTEENDYEADEEDDIDEFSFASNSRYGDVPDDGE